MNQPPSQNFNIDPSTTTIVECQETLRSSDWPSSKTTCGGTLWDQRIELRKVSALVSPTGKEMFLQAPIIVCNTCGSRLPTEHEQV
jgi:hypothetical protein